MKNKSLILLIMISIGFSISNKFYGQQTISYINSTCLGPTKSLKATCLPGINMLNVGNTLLIYGTIEANCCGVHLAEISKRNDSILIVTKDTGDLCKCLCSYCFEINVSLSASDTIVKINNEVFKIPKILGIDEISNEQINLFPNPTAGIVKMTISDIDINGLICEIYSLNGKKIMFQNITSSVVDLNLSSLKSGYYVVSLRNDFNIVYKRMIIKE